MEDPAQSLPSIWASMNSWCTPTILFIFLNLMIGTILFTSNNTNTNNNKQEDNKETSSSHNQNDFIQSNKLARSPSILHRLRSFNFHPHRSQQPDNNTPHQHEQEQEPLEIAATQYVFNHPFSHDLQPDPNTQILDPTRFESFDNNRLKPDTLNDESIPNNAQTHFFFEQKHTVEKVTAHFVSDPVGSGSVSDPDPGRENPEDPETHEEGNDEFQSLDEVYSVITGGGGGHVNRTKSDTLPASGEIPVKLPAKMKKSASLKSAFNHFEEEKIVEARRPATVRERRSAARASAEDDVEVDAKADDFINKFKHQLKLQRLDSIIRYKDMVNRGGGK